MVVRHFFPKKNHYSQQRTGSALPSSLIIDAYMYIVRVAQNKERPVYQYTTLLEIDLNPESLFN